MTTPEQLTTTATLSSLAPLGGQGRGEEVRSSGRVDSARLRRPPSRSLVLSQSWVPYSVSPRERLAMRQSTLKVAEAFSLLSSELATRRGETKPPAA